MHLSFFIAKQLAVIPPEQLEKKTNILAENSAIEFIHPRILELTYTAWDMKPFAEDLGYSGDSFPWDEERRFRICAELDALFFHLYLPSHPDGTWKKQEKETEQEYATLVALFQTPRVAVDYIMDSFQITKRRDIDKFGFFRTKEEILRVYDAMQAAMRNGIGYESPLFQSSAI